MGRCRQHNHRITAIGQQFSKARALRLMIATLGNILCLIDDNNIPICIFKMSSVFNVSFQRVDRNNGLVIVKERVVIGRQTGSDFLDATRIKTHQGDSKTVPHFLLKLRHHTLNRNNKNTFTFAASNQL